MRRDLNVKHYIGKDSEKSQLSNPGDYFRAEDTDKNYQVNSAGTPVEVGAAVGSSYKILRGHIIENYTDQTSGVLIEGNEYVLDGLAPGDDFTGTGYTAGFGSIYSNSNPTTSIHKWIVCS